MPKRNADDDSDREPQKWPVEDVTERLRCPGCETKTCKTTEALGSLWGTNEESQEATPSRTEGLSLWATRTVLKKGSPRRSRRRNGSSVRVVVMCPAGAKASGQREQSSPADTTSIASESRRPELTL
ncbi:hypothetical protein MTO96_015188 [Rhipicephalus appendiculatus]